VSTITLGNTGYFGNAIDIDGDRLAIGNPNYNNVFLFNRIGTDFSNLTLQNTLTVASTEFGASVALDGDRLAVGAQAESTGGTRVGAVYLYSGVGADFSGLTFQDKLASGWTDGITTLTLATFDTFGSDISLDGDLLAVHGHERNLLPFYYAGLGGLKPPTRA